MRSWKLKKYFDEQKPPRPLDLVNPDAAQELGWPFSLVLADKQLEAQANSALYEMTPSTKTASAPAEVTFHWSDGHLDVTKKLKFAQDYQLSIEVAVRSTASRCPRPSPGAADSATAPSTRNRSSSPFYKQNGNLNMLQYKKLGGRETRSSRSSRPARWNSRESRTNFLRRFSFPTAPTWRFGTGRNGITRPQTASRRPSPRRKWPSARRIPGPLKLRVYVGPKDLATARQSAAVARRAGAVRLVRRDRQAAAFRAAMAAPLHSRTRAGRSSSSRWRSRWLLLPMRIWTFHSRARCRRWRRK